MTMRYYFSADGTYLGGYDTGSEALVPTGSIEVQAPPADGRDRLVNGSVVPYTPPVDPLDAITAAVKALPVAKRTDATWGAFVGQCLLAIQHSDNEALAYLIDNFQTQDTDYQTILNQAKTLFGIQ